MCCPPSLPPGHLLIAVLFVLRLASSLIWGMAKSIELSYSYVITMVWTELLALISLAAR